MESPIPQNERDRLTALEGYGVIGTPPEVDFDDIAEMAGQICSCPVSMINLIADKGTPSTSTDVGQLADTPFNGDAAVANGSSIAFLAEFCGTGVLFAADAHAPILVTSIRRLLAERSINTRLPLGAFKVPHHGSQNNLSIELLDLLDCRNYLFSSNGDHFCHPDRQAVARVIKYGGPQPSLRFNYKSRYNEVWAEPGLQEKHGYTSRYPDPEAPGFLISLFPPEG